MGKLRMLPLLLAVLAAAILPAQAAEYDRTGSVTVILQAGEKPVSGAEMSLYRVGDPREGYNLTFVPTADFAGVALEDLQREALPGELLHRVGERNLSGAGKTTGSDGRACFENLTPGLYLVTQEKEVKGFTTAEPFVVSLPMSRGNTWQYDVEARPKVAPDAPKPTVPGGGGGGGKPPLIQTGQLNWPIPVLAVSGILLFSIGWSLAYLKDRRR